MWIYFYLIIEKKNAVITYFKNDKVEYVGKWVAVFNLGISLPLLFFHGCNVDIIDDNNWYICSAEGLN